MKVLICDHADCMMPDHALEIETLRAGLGEDVEVEVLEYEDDKRDEFYEHVADADALLTAFVTVDAEAMDRAPKLKVVSLNSTGFDQVDLDEATKRGIGVCPVGEYCTWDVAESAIAYMGALNKHFKFYQREIDERHKWDYAAAPQWPRLEDQVLGIVGFGKIGKCTAEKAMGLVKRVIACDPHADDAAFAERGVTRVSKEELLAHADIIVNHMCLTDDNVRFFDEAAFDSMARRPIFINLGRGLCVDEEALVDALDAGKLRAFGADVLYDETPDLAANKLVGRDNVIITPHSAFYHGYRRLGAFELREHRPFPERREGEGIQAGQRGVGRNGGRAVASTALPRCARSGRKRPPVTKFAMANRRFSEAENRHQALCRTSSGSVGASGPKTPRELSWVRFRVHFSRESGWMLRAERQDAPSGAGRRLVVSCP